MDPKQEADVANAQRALLKAVDKLTDAAELIEIAAAHLELSKSRLLAPFAFLLKGRSAELLAHGYWLKATDGHLAPFVTTFRTFTYENNNGDVVEVSKGLKLGGCPARHEPSGESCELRDGHAGAHVGDYSGEGDRFTWEGRSEKQCPVRGCALDNKHNGPHRDEDDGRIDVPHTIPFTTTPNATIALEGRSVAAPDDLCLLCSHRRSEHRGPFNSCRTSAGSCSCDGFQAEGRSHVKADCPIGGCEECCADCRAEGRSEPADALPDNVPNDGRSGRCGIRTASATWCQRLHGHDGACWPEGRSLGVCPKRGCHAPPVRVTLPDGFRTAMCEPHALEEGAIVEGRSRVVDSDACPNPRCNRARHNGGDQGGDDNGGCYDAAGMPVPWTEGRS